MYYLIHLHVIMKFYSMDPPSPQNTLIQNVVTKDFMSNVEYDECRPLKDISNFTRNRKNNNEEIFSPERKKFKVQDIGM